MNDELKMSFFSSRFLEKLTFKGGFPPIWWWRWLVAVVTCLASEGWTPHGQPRCFSPRLHWHWAHIPSPLLSELKHWGQRIIEERGGDAGGRFNWHKQRHSTRWTCWSHLVCIIYLSGSAALYLSMLSFIYWRLCCPFFLLQDITLNLFPHK